MRMWHVAARLFNVLGVVALVGGWIGYFRAGSIASAIAGSITCAILIPCARGIRREKKRAAWIAFWVALLLDLRFVMAFARQPKVVPHLILIVLSSLCVLSVGVALWRGAKLRKGPTSN